MSDNQTERYRWTIEPEALLTGAIDMHVHGYPDVGLDHKSRVDDVTMIELANAYGLRGIVLKSHFWPTMDRAFQLTERLALPDFTVFSSITLNPLVGGISAMAVEAAAAHGAKVIFFPTWGSKNDHEKRGVVRRRIIDPCFPSIPTYLETGALSATDDAGELLPAVRDIVALCRDLDLVLATAHISPRESLAIARFAKANGFNKVLFTHPFSPSVGATIGEVLEAADLGATIEFTFAATLSSIHVIPVKDVYDALLRIGATRSIITSDVFFDYSPPQPESLRTFAHQLRFAGCSESEIRAMIVDNPRRLLDVK